jgi:cob(I)alamin adenosyltransferase
LIGGKRVYKDDIQVETYGTIDELISWIGVIRSSSKLPKYNIKMLYSPKNDDLQLRNILLNIQDRLMLCASMVATEKGKVTKIPSVTEEDVLYLESLIDYMDENLDELKNFVLPGGTTISAYCHIGRTVCRRSERLVITLSKKKKTDYDIVIKYLNRLSDFLFTFSRFLNMKSQEVIWKIKKGE